MPRYERDYGNSGAGRAPRGNSRYDRPPVRPARLIDRYGDMGREGIHEGMGRYGRDYRSHQNSNWFSRVEHYGSDYGSGNHTGYNRWDRQGRTRGRHPRG